MWNSGNGANVLLPNRVAALDRAGEEQDFFLDVRGEVQMWDVGRVRAFILTTKVRGLGILSKRKICPLMGDPLANVPRRFKKFLRS